MQFFSLRTGSGRAQPWHSQSPFDLSGDAGEPVVDIDSLSFDVEGAEVLKRRYGLPVVAVIPEPVGQYRHIAVDRKILVGVGSIASSGLLTSLWSGWRRRSGDPAVPPDMVVARQ